MVHDLFFHEFLLGLLLWLVIHTSTVRPSIQMDMDEAADDRLGREQKCNLFKNFRYCPLNQTT
jgi:hypothetical protein